MLDSQEVLLIQLQALHQQELSHTSSHVSLAKWYCSLVIWASTINIHILKLPKKTSHALGIHSSATIVCVGYIFINCSRFIVTQHTRQVFRNLKERIIIRLYNYNTLFLLLLSQPKFNQQLNWTEFEVRLNSYTVIHPPTQTLCCCC